MLFNDHFRHTFLWKRHFSVSHYHQNIKMLTKSDQNNTFAKHKTWNWPWSHGLIWICQTIKPQLNFSVLCWQKLLYRMYKWYVQDVGWYTSIVAGKHENDYIVGCESKGHYWRCIWIVYFLTSDLHVFQLQLKCISLWWIPRPLLLHNNIS